MRFLSADGSKELKYEVVEWQPNGTSSFWVLLPELNASTSIQAVWGNTNQTRQPAYCIDGSVWQKYHGVWHMDEEDENLIRDSKGSFHATPTNFENLKVDGVIKSAVNFDGINDYLNMSLDAILQQEPNNLPFLSGPMENWKPLKIPPSLNPVLHLVGTSMFITRGTTLGLLGCGSG